MEYLARVKIVSFKDRQGKPVKMTGLFPIDLLQQEKLKKLKPNEIVSNNVKHFRKKNHSDQAHAILHFLWENWHGPNSYPSLENFRGRISNSLGYSEPSTDRCQCGRFHIKAKSWSYEVGQDEFMEGLYHPLIEFAGAYLDMSRDELIEASIESSHNNK